MRKLEMPELGERYHEHFAKMNSPSKEAFESIARHYLEWYGGFLPPDKNAKILDVGCGMGHFLYFLEAEGYKNYCGIDSSAEQVQFVRKNLTSRVIVADIFDYLNASGSFEVIVANDVLEHIPKDRTLELLTLAHDSLERGGFLFIKTPNMSNPFSMRFRYIDFTHEVGFTEESLRQVLRASGFQEIQIKGGSYVVQSFKSRLGKLGEQIAHKMLKQSFILQGYGLPGILDAHLIAVSERR
jgi:2-polyprenyl-3-methyl-5-hydroxy-6-metoxy-1,4-benzoquinol methylase